MSSIANTDDSQINDESTNNNVDKIAPGLLIASVALDDPNFERSVILMIEHSKDEGAVGIVLNKPSDTSVMDLCEDQGIESVDAKPIRIGGPLANERVWILHRQSDISHDSFEIADGIGVSLTKEALTELAGKNSPLDQGNPYLICAGYAGWGPGQLEAEIESGTWVPYPVESDVIFATDPETMWSQLLLSLGQFTASNPNDQTVN